MLQFKPRPVHMDMTHNVLTYPFSAISEIFEMAFGPSRALCGTQMSKAVLGLGQQTSL